MIAFKFALVDATGRPSRGPGDGLLSFLIILGAAAPLPLPSSLFLFSECPAVPSAQHCFSPSSSFLFHRLCPVHAANQTLWRSFFHTGHWTPVDLLPRTRTICPLLLFSTSPLPLLVMIATLRCTRPPELHNRRMHLAPRTTIFPVAPRHGGSIVTL